MRASIVRAATYNMLGLCWVLTFAQRSPADIIEFNGSGYSATHFAYANGLGDNLAIDSSGRVYAPENSLTTNPGVYRFSPAGSGALWSQAAGNSLAIGPDGYGYLATRGVGDSILRIAPDGSYSTLVSGLQWTWVAIGPQGNLFANVWAGTGQGLYSIDPNTGATTQLVAGGPGPNGAGFYEGMTVGSDGSLYANGNDGTESGLFRLDSSNHFDLVSVLPFGGLGLAQGPNGDFFSTSTVPNGGLLLVTDPVTGASGELAVGFQSPSGLAFDPQRNLLYVRDQAGAYEITAISFPANIVIPIGLIGMPEPPTWRFALLGMLLLFAYRWNLFTKECRGQPTHEQTASAGGV